MDKKSQIQERNQMLEHSLQQRKAELALFSSIQEALLSQKEMSFIFELVGDQLHTMFDGYIISIATFDHDSGTEYFQYHLEEGKRIYPDPRPYNKIRQILIDTHTEIVVNENTENFVNDILGVEYVSSARIDIPKSFLFAPLVVNEVVRGYISLKHNEKETVFDEEHIRLLNSLAKSISVTLQSERLIKTERRKADEQKALLDTMTDLSSKLDLNLLLGSVLERAVSLLGVTGGELAIYHEDLKALEVVASHNLGMNSSGVFLKLGEGAMGRVAATLEPLIIPDYQAWEGRSDQYAENINSVMVVPLLIGNQLVGALASAHLEKNRHFNSTDLELLNMFAPLAATAIENARLFEAERRRADEQKALLDTMTDLSSKLDLNLLLGSVLERAVSLLGVTGGELAIYHEDLKALEVVASHNLGMNSSGVFLKLGEGAMGRVAATLEPLIIPDYQAWEGRSDQYAENINSVMVVPLLIGNQLVGALASAHLEKNRHFNSTDLKLLNMFAPLAATAIENARLFEAERRRAEEQKALLDTMTDLSSKLDLNLLLGAVLERAVSLLGVTGGELAIYHEDLKALEVVASHNLGMNSSGVFLKLGEGAMGRVAATLEPLIIPDYQAWEGRSDQYAENINSVMVVPLLIGNQLVGALASAHLEKNRHFNSTDLKLLNMFAPLAATAIENARLFEAERRRAEEQKALLDTMTDLSSKLDLNLLLGAVLERAVSLLGVTGGELAIYHEDLKALEVVASHKLGMNSSGVFLKLGEGAMGRVAATLEPLIIPDYQAWEGRSDQYAENINSVMVVPLLIGNQLVGALASAHLEKNRHFNNTDLKLLNMFAPLAATAIENARLFNKTTRLLEEAEQRTKELRRTQTQLIQQEKLASLGELTAGIAHEIQNPLNFVNNFSEINTELISEMKEEMDKGNISGAKSIADEVSSNETKINHHGKRADAIVKGMLQHSRSSSGIKEPTDINILADEYLRLAYHGLRAKDKSFNASMLTDFDPELGKISVLPQDMGRVILNLITNAFYAVSDKKRLGVKGYKPTVSVSTKKEENKVIISVRDNGNGVPQKVMDKIFQPFFTTKPTGEGTGLGLSMSYDIVTKGHGGDLTMESKEGEYAVFAIVLPV